MHPEEERERLRQTFNQAADSYDRVRPDYPDALFDDLVALTGLAPGDHLIEVGCATGKATRPLARRGFRITCVELGAELAAAARANLAGSGVEVVHGSFEEWRPDEPARLVYAATAWHWIDPAVRYQRAWQALHPGGYLAIWGAGQVFPAGGDPFFEELQEIYDEIGEGQRPGEGRPRPGELTDNRADIEASGLFEVTAVRHYDWERVYGADEYIELLDTFSGHLAMPGWKRERLYTEIRRRLALRRDHSVRRGWGAVLQVARRGDRVSGPAGSG
ncbi:MAG: methyltransferase domain-containing protein [Streptosporangiaceae bacterium]